MLIVDMEIPEIHDCQEHIHFMKHAATVIEGKIDSGFQVCGSSLT